MTDIAAPRELRLRLPIAGSALLHAVAAAALLFARTTRPAPQPPTYAVTLVAAPPGERRIGVVQPPPAASTAPDAPAPIARETPDPSRMKALSKAKPARTPKTATPNTATSVRPSPAPIAGGGPVGGRGADVANVSIAGVQFPYPSYLTNVVRQIALRFRPTRADGLRAEVAFLIRRDGSVAGLRLQTRSGVYGFDTEALGAVDAAARAGAFGPLPQGFSDDVLPVIFSFDPRLIR
ncbi:MAG: TonB C-terminal domain-containing protein [Gemmatimonadaceae bacterium]|nr:TonB C-terminal domain-containing protein [Gemmatimonadaceae bacterium]